MNKEQKKLHKIKKRKEKILHEKIYHKSHANSLAIKQDDYAWGKIVTFVIAGVVIGVSIFLISIK